MLPLHGVDHDEHPTEDALEAYVMRTLPAPMIGPLETHLASCTLCGERLAKTKEFVTAIRAAAAECLSRDGPKGNDSLPDQKQGPTEPDWCKSNEPDWRNLLKSEWQNLSKSEWTYLPKRAWSRLPESGWYYLPEDSWHYFAEPEGWVYLSGPDWYYVSREGWHMVLEHSHWDSGVNCWSADPPMKNLPEPRKRTQICRECKREFEPGLKHIGYINVCPACRLGRAIT